MQTVVLLSFLNNTVLGPQPLQTQTYPSYPIPNPPCQATFLPPETSLSLFNGSDPQTVCRSPSPRVVRWNSTDWLSSRLENITLGENLRTAADTSGSWWLSVNQRSGSTGGNGGSRSIVWRLPDRFAVVNTTSITIQDIQWSPVGLFFLGTPGGPSIYTSGIGTIDAAGGPQWIVPTQRMSMIQTFIAPETSTGPMYIVGFSVTPTLETWLVNATGGTPVWSLSSTTILRGITTGTVVRAFQRDRLLWLLTPRALFTYDFVSNSLTNVLSLAAGLSAVSMVSAVVQVPPLPSVTPSATMTPSWSPTMTPSWSPTVSPTGTSSSSPSATASTSITATVSPSITPSLTSTMTITPTPGTSVSRTPDVSPSMTITPTPYPSASPTASVSRYPDPSPEPPSGNSNGTIIVPPSLSGGEKAGVAIATIIGLGFLGSLGFLGYRRLKRPIGTQDWGTRKGSVTGRRAMEGDIKARVAMLQQMTRTGTLPRTLAPPRASSGQARTASDIAHSNPLAILQQVTHYKTKHQFRPVLVTTQTAINSV